MVLGPLVSEASRDSPSDQNRVMLRYVSSVGRQIECSLLPLATLYLPFDIFPVPAILFYFFLEPDI